MRGHSNVPSLRLLQMATVFRTPYETFVAEISCLHDLDVFLKQGLLQSVKFFLDLLFPLHLLK